ncbi:DUF3888 domain-containing protein [Clostridium sp. SHJSY1]|uniref:DUF3888 domain-containing protein n=1 Tax=Clostridium sp. SHJSY1 TaxID=2942483 RepID=UPI002875872C|nr:DUF3888 domain-containing protein [Clostridium sp. SHJSY1]MDS0527130.1 DUF3888 domain-containing protein [Clostridium sp. SHJSY1]
MVLLKKIVFVISLLTVITTFTFPCSAYELAIKQQPKIEQYEVTENSKEIIYRDMVISLLIPYMQKEINNYYKEYLTELPVIFPYSVDIVNVDRQGGSGYLIRLEVIAHPFVGPINIVGDDRMIIETGAFGSVLIKKFEHIKSYPLPWNWQHIIKKAY